MSWRTVKQSARDVVHATMGYPCVYKYKTTEPINCVVRHHRKTAFIGDDTDEFSAGLLSQLNRVIIDLRQVPSPQRGATLTWVNEAGTAIPNEPTLELLTFTPQGEHYIMCEVKVK